MDPYATKGGGRVPNTNRYPVGGTGDGNGAGHDGRPKARAARSTYLLWVLGVVLVVAFVVLHLTGVLGPGGH